MRRTRCAGFTVVELLVVMIIIAILAGAMLLTHWGGESSARAIAVLSDLRVMKAGAFLFFAESPDVLPVEGVNYAEALGKYMDNQRIINDPVHYALFVSAGIWWVGVKVDGSENSRVRELIEGKAVAQGSSMALYGSDDIENPPVAVVPSNLYKKSNSAVWTRAR